MQWNIFSSASAEMNSPNRAALVKNSKTRALTWHRPLIEGQGQYQHLHIPANYLHSRYIPESRDLEDHTHNLNLVMLLFQSG